MWGFFYLWGGDHENYVPAMFIAYQLSLLVFRCVAKTILFLPM